MKQGFLTLLFAVITNIILAQEPRPDWVRQPPYPPRGANFIYVYGMGEGKTEQEAEFLAWKNALYKAFNEGGLIGIPEQAKTFDKIFSMNDLETIVPDHVLPRRLACQTLPIFLSKDKIKVYILLQVKRDGSKPTDFNDYGVQIDCEPKDFKNELREWNRIEYQQQKKDMKKAKKMNSSFFTNGHNNYLAWGILNTGYPFTLGTSFIGRHGNVVGVGYYLSIGVDFGGNSTYDDDESTYTLAEYDFEKKFIAPLQYAVGLKIFLYKDIFLSVGYGTLGCKKTNTFNDSEGRWGTEGWRQGKGLILTAGYDVLVGNLKNGNFFLSTSAGVSYDTFLDEWNPLINIKLGVAWGLNN